MTQVNTMEVIKEIHTQFDTASDRLLNEAKEILANDAKWEAEKSDRLKKLGFGRSNGVKKFETIQKQKTMAKPLISAILYFKEKYPFNKFITREEVDKICEKYSLLLGDAERYIGDIPEKNLQEIESFKLREEDFTVEQNDWMDNFGMLIPRSSRSLIDEFGSWDNRNSDNDLIGMYFSRARQTGMQERLREQERALWDSQKRWAFGIDPIAQPKSDKKSKKQKAAFKIVAPKTDFELSNSLVVGNEIVNYIPDPIVLQPVKDGFLVISKWGLEGQDESLVNEKLN